MMVTESQAYLEQSKYQNNEVADETLIQSFLESQDSSYFDQLYSKYAKKIFSKCMGLLKHTDTAREGTQEILLKVFLNLSAFDGTSKFSTWVYALTYNFCIDQLRAIKKEGKIFSDEMEQTTDVVEIPDDFLLEIAVDKLKVVLDNIPVGDKAILLMKFQENMRIEEISSILNESESATKLKLSKAKWKAKKVYEAKFQPASSNAIRMNLESVKERYAFG